MRPMISHSLQLFVGQLGRVRLRPLNCGITVLLLAFSLVHAQPLTTIAPVQSTRGNTDATKSGGIAASGPHWRDLSPAQQESLSPLQNTWDTLDSYRKGKWIAIAKNYFFLAPPEQAKLHSRMAEWAALNPKDRELARFNFLESKKLSPNRASTWESYKALSQAERQHLAAKAMKKPSGAATLIKPNNAKELTIVPVTRNSPMQAQDLVFSKQLVDRHTLLPLTKVNSGESAPN